MLQAHGVARTHPASSSPPGQSVSPSQNHDARMQRGACSPPVHPHRTTQPTQPTQPHNPHHQARPTVSARPYHTDGVNIIHTTFVTVLHRTAIDLGWLGLTWVWYEGLAWVWYQRLAWVWYKVWRHKGMTA